MKARFELHPQGSDAEHAELRLRFLENLTPITRTPPDGYPRRTTVVEPRPGELLIRGKFDIKPWALSFTLKSGYAKLVREFLAERALEKEKYGI
jgi:hypothetical protein